MKHIKHIEDFLSENVSVVGYRNIHSNSVGKLGTFYNVRRPVHYDSRKVKLTFNNPLIVKDSDIYNFEGLSLEYLFWKWFPDLEDSYKIMAKREGIEGGEFMDKMVTDEAIRRGYDGIIMGDLEVIDLRTHKNFKK